MTDSAMVKRRRTNNDLQNVTYYGNFANTFVPCKMQIALFIYLSIL